MRKTQCLILSFFLLFLPFQAQALLTDSDINFNVLGLIGRDYQVRHLSIEATTRSCIVSLVGSTYTQANAVKLIQIAYGASGVRDVDTSDLRLDWGRPISLDSIIIGKMRGAFSKENLFRDGRSWLYVDSRNGCVFLSGTVNCQAIIDRAIALAYSLSEVRTVRSRVRVLH